MNKEIKKFVVVYEKAYSAKDAAKTLKVTPQTVRIRSFRLRKLGVNLKKFNKRILPISSGDIAALNKLIKRIHKAK